jgi:acetyltransferase-like isoleucine patch superfamily enzyme
MSKKVKFAFARIARKLGLTDKSLLQLRYPEYEIGCGSYGLPDVVANGFGETKQLRIGKYCSIAKGVTIYLGSEHRPDWATTYPFNIYWPEAHAIKGHPQSKGDVVIGNDVWIATDALVLSGVHIGDGAVIGARAVITRDVAPYMIVAGNPAKPIRSRFDQPTIDRFLALKWWDWPKDKIARALPDLMATDVAHFLNKAENGAY